MTFEPLFRAAPVPRGCGERTPGGFYVESGLGPNGRPLEEFLLDPPLPIPSGLDLVNKPQVVADAETGVSHLLIWVGAEWYPYLPDFLEEARAYGVSRKLSPFVDVTQLTPASRLILAHPYALNSDWREQSPPLCCFKQIPGHEEAHRSRDWAVDAAPATGAGDRPNGGPPKRPSPRRHAVTRLLSSAPTSQMGEQRSEGSERQGAQPVAVLERVRGEILDGSDAGPCLFKTYNLMPIEAADGKTPRLVVNGHTYYRREIGSTAYLYAPSGEPSNGLAPGVFAALPITGFALIRRADGSVNEHMEAKLQRAGLPYYASDK